jgi:hypothetical protein
LLPRLTVPGDDPTLAIRDIVGATINRRLMILTRDISLTPALDHFSPPSPRNSPTDVVDMIIGARLSKSPDAQFFASQALGT